MQQKPQQELHTKPGKESDKKLDKKLDNDMILVNTCSQNEQNRIYQTHTHNKTRKKILPAFAAALAAAAMLAFCACGNSGGKVSDNQPQTSAGDTQNDDSKNQAAGDTNSDAADGQSSVADTKTDGSENPDNGANSEGSSARVEMTDPSGAKISVPKQINSIVVLAPSLSEIVTAFDMGDKVVGYDSYSTGIKGLPEDVPTFEITNPDMEQLAALSPDVMLISNETLYDQESPFQALIDTGTCVICVPNSDDIADIKSDIEFLASALGASETGSALLDKFDKQLNALADIAAKIPQEERKRVYFEVAPAPNMYSFGNGVFLNEMIEWIGAENILAGQSGWLTVEGETIVKENPDVIFTNANYNDDPVKEILSRDGWADISAVANKEVYCVDSDSSSQPNHNIIKAMRQMAEHLYPDYYKSK